MNLPIEQIRALLLQLDLSDWSELSFSTNNWSVFMTKSSVANNPMRGQGLKPKVDVSAAQEHSDYEALPVFAEHLGIFSSDFEVGQTVRQGSKVGAITVLDRITPIMAETSGAINMLCETGELVEYGQTILLIEPHTT